MPFPILCIVLFSSFLHAGWNYLSKTIPGGVLFVWLLAVVMGIILMPLVVWQLYEGGFIWDFVHVRALFLTSVLHSVYFLVLQKGYQEADLSVVYPLARGMGPVFSGIGAYWFLQETITSLDILGLLCVGTGALIIGGFNLRQLFQPASGIGRDPRLQKGIFYGIFTGVLIACYTIFDAYSVTKLGIPPIFVEYTSHPARILFLMPFVLKKRTEVVEIWAGHWQKILVIALVSPIAFLLILYAMKSAPVHAIAPIREFSIVIGVVLGAKLLAESQLKIRLIGSMMILLGIFLLAIR